MEDDTLPDGRTVHGHNIQVRDVGDDGSMSFYVDSLATVPESFADVFDIDTSDEVLVSAMKARIVDAEVDIDLVDGTMTLGEAEDIHEAMLEMEDEYPVYDGEYIGFKNWAVRRICEGADIEIESADNGFVVFFDGEDLHPDDYQLQTTRGEYETDKEYYWYFDEIVDVDECDEYDFVTGDW